MARRKNTGQRGRRGYRRRGLARRILDVGMMLALLFAVAVAVAWLRERNAVELSGRPQVADGDSLQFGGRRVRLEGIDAPELAQDCIKEGRVFACGRAARTHLVALIDGRKVVCESLEEDQYERALARCRAGETDLNGEMVRDGWAVAYGSYQVEEAEARRAGRGLWALSFERPAEWRRVNHARLPAANLEGTGIIEGALTNLVAWIKSVWD